MLLRSPGRLPLARLAALNQDLIALNGVSNLCVDGVFLLLNRENLKAGRPVEHKILPETITPYVDGIRPFQ